MNYLLRDLKTVPNLLSIYRIFAMMTAVTLFLLGYPVIGVLVGISGGMTDYADGYYARKYNMSTELGALLDGLADIIFTFLAMVVAVYKGVWPLYLIFLWGLRDLTVLGMRASAAEMLFRIPSSMVGKVASNVIFYSLVIMCFDYAFDPTLNPEAHDVPALVSQITHWLGIAGIHAGIAMQWYSAATYTRIYLEGYNRFVRNNDSELRT